MDKNKYRGLTKEGKEVKGYYAKKCIGEDGKFVDIIIDSESLFDCEVDPKTVGQFVCPDKNDKEVFDKSTVWFSWMGEKSKARINKGDFFIQLEALTGENIRGLPRTLCRFDIQHIELIEETK